MTKPAQPDKQRNIFTRARQCFVGSPGPEPRTGIFLNNETQNERENEMEAIGKSKFAEPIEITHSITRGRVGPHKVHITMEVIAHGVSVEEIDKMVEDIREAACINTTTKERTK